MKKLLLSTAISATLLALSSNAFAGEKVTMGTGSLEGQYNTVICPAIKKEVYPVVDLTCKPDDGTGANFDAIANGERLTGLGQFDVSGLKFERDETEELEERIGTLGYLKSEGLFCAAKVGGRVPQEGSWAILNDEETMEKPFVVSTGKETSGTFGTIDFLRTNFPNFSANTKVRAKKKFKFDSEVGRLRSGKRDMVCFVSVPSPEGDKFKTVAEAKDLFFVPFDDAMLETLQINGLPAYKIADATVSGGKLKALAGLGGKVRTIHTGVTVLVDEENISEAAYNVIAKAAKNPKLLVGDDWLSKLEYKSRKQFAETIAAFNDVKRKVTN